MAKPFSTGWVVSLLWTLELIAVKGSLAASDSTSPDVKFTFESYEQGVFGPAILVNPQDTVNYGPHPLAGFQDHCIQNLSACEFGMVVSLWVKVLSFVGNRMYFMSSDSGATPVGVSLFYENGQMICQVRSRTEIVYGVLDIELFKPLGTWHNVVMTIMPLGRNLKCGVDFLNEINNATSKVPELSGDQSIVITLGGNQQGEDCHCVLSDLLIWFRIFDDRFWWRQYANGKAQLALSMEKLTATDKLPQFREDGNQSTCSKISSDALHIRDTFVEVMWNGRQTLMDPPYPVSVALVATGWYDINKVRLYVGGSANDCLRMVECTSDPKADFPNVVNMEHQKIGHICPCKPEGCSNVYASLKAICDHSEDCYTVNLCSISVV